VTDHKVVSPLMLTSVWKMDASTIKVGLFWCIKANMGYGCRNGSCPSLQPYKIKPLLQ